MARPPPPNCHAARAGYKKVARPELDHAAIGERHRSHPPQDQPLVRLKEPGRVLLRSADNVIYSNPGGQGRRGEAGA
jgi:hypothetical protein